MVYYGPGIDSLIPLDHFKGDIEYYPTPAKYIIENNYNPKSLGFECRLQFRLHATSA